MEQITKIDDITFKENLWPRTGVNYIEVYNYSQKMKAGVVFPPIILGKIGSELILVDGYHRMLATKNLKEEYIKAEIIEYNNEIDLFKDAIKYNNQHGIQLTSSDNVKILATLQDMQFSPLEIGELLKATPERVQRYKSRIIRKQNGSRVFLKSPIARLLEKGHITEEEACNIDQSQFTVPSVKALMVQIIAILEGNAYPWAIPDMRALAVEVYQLLGRSVNINDVS